VRITRLTGVGLAAVLLTVTGCTEKTIGGSGPAPNSSSPCRNEQRTLETAAEAYNSQMEIYPESVDQLLLPATAPDGTKVPAMLRRRPKYWVLDRSGNAMPKPGVDMPDDC
jgi:hypothetical protein